MAQEEQIVPIVQRAERLMWGGRDIELAKKQYHEYVNDIGYLTDEEGLFD